MIASQIAAALDTLLKIRQPAFLWGPPGIGKSQVVKQTATAMGLQLIDIRAILLDPVDLRGIPRISPEGVSQWCAPEFLPREGEGVLFLDELNAAPPLVQAACYQLVLDRRLGEYRLPDGWAMVAAGNREQDRAVAHRMPSALANRFVHLEFAVDDQDWLAWAESAGLSHEVISFIRFRPSLLHRFDPDKDDKAFPSPRSWEFVSKLVDECPNSEILKSLVSGAVGQGAAAEFMGFLEIWEQLPDPCDIIAQPERVEIPKDPAVLFALSEMMGQVLDESNADALMIWASRLPVEFSVLLVREAVRKNNGIIRTQAFGAWAACHSDVLI